jgi:ATP adenylyltransferase
MEYIENNENEGGCIFCMAAEKKDSIENLILHRGKRTFIILNLYPYTSGHIMVSPYKHVSSLEALDPKTRAEMMELVSKSLTILKTIYKPQAFNLGANIGEAAGAGIPDHFHMHIVPRWAGDTNFMSSVGGTRVLPEALEDTYKRVRDEFLKSQK